MATRAVIDERGFAPANIITRDVVIIGGGAAGTYAAVRLQEDLGVSIVVIEKDSTFGGQVETYSVPEAEAIDAEITLLLNSAYNTKPSVSHKLTAINVDITTGEVLQEYTPPSANASTEAFKIWLQFLETYEPFTEPGYWNFPYPGAIPLDFLIPFTEFAKKHGIEAAIPQLAQISGAGTGGLQTISTLPLIRVFGAPITRSFLKNDLFVPNDSNSLLYQLAYDRMKEHVYLESSIKEMQRNADGVRLIVSTKDEDVLIKAKKIIWTPSTSRRNLADFDADWKELQVFNQWIPYWSFVGILSIPCIPENYSIVYLPSTIIASNYLAVHDHPYNLQINSTGPSGLGLFRVVFGTNYSITHDEAKEIITQSIRKLVEAKTLNYTGDCNVQFRKFVDHNGVLWPQSRENLENGFVQDLYALQGYRSTYYIGKGFSGRYSSDIWAYTETVIGRMVGQLKDYCLFRLTRELAWV